jgi:ornithine carbamoyltransferase
MPGVEFVRFNDVADLRAKFSNEVCAICIESIQGEGGIRPVSQEFFAAARELTRLHRRAAASPMRFRPAWAAPASGAPISTTAFCPTSPRWPSRSPAAFPWARCSAPKRPRAPFTRHARHHLRRRSAGLRRCHRRHRHDRERNLLAMSTEVGDYFKQQLRELAKPRRIVDVRGKGPDARRELDSADLAKLSCRRCWSATSSSIAPAIRCCASCRPYILRKEHVDQAIAALDEIFTEHAHNARAQQYSRRTNPWQNRKEQRAADDRNSRVQQDQSDILRACGAPRGEDLCSIADLSVQEMAAIMELGHAVKRNPREYFRHALDAKQMVLFFEKASLRTRLTFETGINTLGGNAIFVDQTQSPLGERESIADMARNVERWMMSSCCAPTRTTPSPRWPRTLAVPVINALSDFEHPCQAIADFMTLEERFGSVEGLNFTYVGDGNNVCHSLMLTGAQLGAHCTVATPRGFAPKLEIIHKAIEIAESTGGSITLTQDPIKAVTGADAVYTDVCTSMGFEHESTKRAPIFKPFQVNEALMAHAQPTPSSCTACPRTATPKSPMPCSTARSRSSSTRPKTACTRRRRCC